MANFAKFSDTPGRQWSSGGGGGDGPEILFPKIRRIFKEYAVSLINVAIVHFCGIPGGGGMVRKRATNKVLHTWDWLSEGLGSLRIFFLSHSLIGISSKTSPHGIKYLVAAEI